MNPPDDNVFLPHGGYRKLRGYKVAEAVYLAKDHVADLPSAPDGGVRLTGLNGLSAPKEEDLARVILEAIDMDSYRAEKKAALAVALPDENAEIEPVPVTGGGRKQEPELDRLSNILKTFNDQFATLFSDADRVRIRISEDIAPRVATDAKYVNARKNNDRQNARIEHDQALGRVMTVLLKDDTELFKQFSDNQTFRRWLTDTIFAMTYE